MGEINISFEAVRQKIDQLNQNIQNEFLGDIISHYNNLDNVIEQSGGKSIDAIRELLQQERKTLLGVSNFMTELLNFIQNSSNAFEDVDINHEEILK